MKEATGEALIYQKLIDSRNFIVAIHRSGEEIISIASSGEMYQFPAMITFKNEIDARGETQLSLGVFFYAPILAILLMIIALIVKLMCNCEQDDADRGEARPNENSRLLLFYNDEVLFNSYGTSEEEDLESGKRSWRSSSEDLYDGKICVICYDDQRSCLFIPCGHCVTCYTCAKRIISEEIKTCPICRTFINKVMKLHIL